MEGLEACLERGALHLLVVLVGVFVGWWIYVPCHELLHALFCWMAGGEVSRLEIGFVYGGGLLARLLPFVDPSGAHAGRLSGFDTHGSDLVYLATDFGPYILTLFPGVWMLRLAGRSGRSFPLGFSIPLALAPFVSLTGDAYEIGSILVTHGGPWSTPALSNLLRGDEMFARIGEVHAGGQPVAWIGLAVSFFVGCLWAWVTYLAGGAVASLLGQPASLRPRSRPGPSVDA